MFIKSSVFLLTFSSLCFAHSGNLDSNGGHLNRDTRSYHCHDNPCLLPSNIEKNQSNALTIASFNIKFLGHYTNKDHRALAGMIDDFDVVFIQELVAPPVDGKYFNADPFNADTEAAEFFNFMVDRGYEYWLSQEDTGTNEVIHKADTSTEWFAAFYRPEKVSIRPSLTAYLAQDRSNNKNFERVPYAFAFRTELGLDFIAVSVHLDAGSQQSDVDRRKGELKSIVDWVLRNKVNEPLIIIGDMNFEDCSEIDEQVPEGFTPLNKGDDCLPTNTSPTSPKPFDNVFVNELFTSSVEYVNRFQVIDLVQSLETYWDITQSSPYPGHPYYSSKFEQYFSDHNPIYFEVIVSEKAN